MLELPACGILPLPGTTVSIRESQELWWQQRYPSRALARLIRRSNLHLETTAQVTGSLSDGFTYTARWSLVPLAPTSTRCAISVQCDFKGSYLSGIGRVPHRSTQSRLQMQWRPTVPILCARRYSSGTKPASASSLTTSRRYATRPLAWGTLLTPVSQLGHIDSGNEETPGTSEEERAMPGPSEVPTGARVRSPVCAHFAAERKALPLDSATVFRAPVPLSAAARYALLRTASPAPREASPVNMQAPTSPDPQSEEEEEEESADSRGFVDADAPTAKQVRHTTQRPVD